MPKQQGFALVSIEPFNILKKMLDEHTSQNTHIYSYGPVIHNPQVVEHFNSQGVTIIHTLDELDTYPPGELLIRSHGVSEETIKKIQERGFTIVDSTCPYVKKNPSNC